MLQAALSSEWTKAAIAGIVGLTAGLLAEPLKARLMEKVKVRRMIRAMHFEIAGALYELDSVKSLAENAETHFAIMKSKDIKFPVFDYYFEKERDLLYGDKSLVFLSRSFGELRRHVQLIPSTDDIPREVNWAIGDLKSDAREGRLKAELIDEWTRKRTYRAIDDTDVLVRRITLENGNNPESVRLAQEWFARSKALRAKIPTQMSRRFLDEP